VVVSPDRFFTGLFSRWQLLVAKAVFASEATKAQCVVFRSRRPGLDINPTDGQRVAIQTELPYYAD
jgi:hypothetical protein